MMIDAPYRYLVSSRRWCSVKEYIGMFVCFPAFKSARHYGGIAEGYIPIHIRDSVVCAAEQQHTEANNGISIASVHP